MDDDRLKEPDNDYFEELLARIRDIRASEKLFYKKVLDIYATAVDYDPRAETSTQFFQTVQNKMHHAAHGQTAEIGRAHVCTPVTNAHLVFRLLLEKTTKKNPFVLR